MARKARICSVLFAAVLLTLGSNADAAGFTLTVNVVGSGSVTKNPTNSVYPSGAVVTITASNSVGWDFANWSGDATGTNNPLNVTMDADKVITATFQQIPSYTLTLATNGQGTISLSPLGGVYLSNTVVTATATPAAGWIFASWSGSTNGNANPLSITMNANNSLTGTFAQLPAFDVLPQSVTNAVGSTVSFSSHAVGSAPLSYQWFFNSSSLSGATNNGLTLTNVQSSQAGNYWIVATNSYGTATSSVVTLVLTNSSGSTNVVSVPTEASLRAAISVGGWVSITCSGIITITNTINITNNVILDAQNVSAVISGGNAVRLFYVAPGVTFSVTNLTLANGAVTNNPTDGGAIYNNGGMVTLVSCVLTNNSAQALVYAGMARGGAVFNNGGEVSFYGSSVSNNAVVGGIQSVSIDTVINGGLGFGGAIFSTNGSMTIANSIVNSNLCTAGGGPNGGCFGGAVFVGAGSTTISESSFANNLALGGASPSPFGRPGSAVPIPAYGGALAAISGNVAIGLSQFAGNTAKGGDSGGHTAVATGFGGAIYSTSTLTAESSTFSGNQALPGNGGYPYNNPNALADGCGGGLYNAGTAVLDRCSIYSNYVQGATPTTSLPGSSAAGADGLGGGIFNASQLAITNCTIALNSAVAGSGSFGSPSNGNALGGGLYNTNNATSTLMNDTIASNYCIASGPGFYGINGLAAGVQIANTNGTLHLHNSIIAYGGTNGNAYGTITDDGYNICSDGTAQLFGGSSYNFTDPKLGPLADYGGPTLCMALLSNSPAIDFGDSSVFPSTDQRGYVRPFGAGVDIGAYEYGSYQQLFIPYLNITSIAGNVLLSFTASPSSSYRLQASTNLSTWTDLNTNGPFSSSTNISQAIDKQGLNLRFFRLLVQ